MGIPSRFFDDAASNLHIHPDRIETLLRGSHNDGIVQRMVKECWSEAVHASPRGPMFIEGRLMALATRILTLALGAEVNHPPEASGLDKGLSNSEFDILCQYVDSQMDTNLRIKTLADLLRMNEHAFSAALKARTGLTPYQWVIERRLGRAEQLLRSTKLDISEIALTVGFPSQAHMTTLFSRRMGVTPSEYHKQTD